MIFGLWRRRWRHQPSRFATLFSNHLVDRRCGGWGVGSPRHEHCKSDKNRTYFTTLKNPNAGADITSRYSLNLLERIA
jgi:hypothetical protein